MAATDDVHSNEYEDMENPQHSPQVGNTDSDVRYAAAPDRA